MSGTVKPRAAAPQIPSSVTTEGPGPKQNGQAQNGTAVSSSTLTYPAEASDDVNMNEVNGLVSLDVTLPNGQRTEITVDYNTPMLDLLVCLAGKSKLSPTGLSLILVSEDSGNPISYKPNQTIGSLGGRVVRIVSKDVVLAKPTIKDSRNEKPFEVTQRFTVNFPRGQKAVVRVNPSMTLGNLIITVCQDKGLDHEIHKYILQIPGKPGLPVDLNATIQQVGVHEMNLVAVALQDRNHTVSMPDLSRPPSSGDQPLLNTSSSTGEQKKKKGFLSFLVKKDKKNKSDVQQNLSSASFRTSAAQVQRPTTPPSSQKREHNPDQQMNRPKSMFVASNAVSEDYKSVEENLQPLVAPARKKRRAPVPPVPTISHTSGKQKSFSSSESNIPLALNGNASAKHILHNEIATITPANLPEEVSTAAFVTPQQGSRADMLSRLHSRNSSDSSGYHELTLSGCESPEASHIGGSKYKTSIDTTSIESSDNTKGDGGIHESPVRELPIIEVQERIHNNAAPVPPVSTSQGLTVSSTDTLANKKRKAPAPPIPQLPAPPIPQLPDPPMSQLPDPPISQLPASPIPQLSAPPIPQLPDPPMPQLPSQPISQLPDPPISQLPDPPISQLPDTPISQLPDPPIPQLPDPPIPQLPDPPMPQLPDPPMPQLPASTKTAEAATADKSTALKTINITNATVKTQELPNSSTLSDQAPSETTYLPELPEATPVPGREIEISALQTAMKVPEPTTDNESLVNELEKTSRHSSEIDLEQSQAFDFNDILAGVVFDDEPHSIELTFAGRSEDQTWDKDQEMMMETSSVISENIEQETSSRTNRPCAFIPPPPPSEPPPAEQSTDNLEFAASITDRTFVDKGTDVIDEDISVTASSNLNSPDTASSGYKNEMAQFVERMSKQAVESAEKTKNKPLDDSVCSASTVFSSESSSDTGSVIQYLRTNSKDSYSDAGSLTRKEGNTLKSVDMHAQVGNFPEDFQGRHIESFAVSEEITEPALTLPPPPEFDDQDESFDDSSNYFPDDVKPHEQVRSDLYADLQISKTKRKIEQATELSKTELATGLSKTEQATGLSKENEKRGIVDSFKTQIIPSTVITTEHSPIPIYQSQPKVAEPQAPPTTAIKEEFVLTSEDLSSVSFLPPKLKKSKPYGQTQPYVQTQPYPLATTVELVPHDYPLASRANRSDSTSNGNTETNSSQVVVQSKSQQDITVKEDKSRTLPSFPTLRPTQTNNTPTAFEDILADINLDPFLTKSRPRLLMNSSNSSSRKSAIELTEADSDRKNELSHQSPYNSAGAPSTIADRMDKRSSTSHDDRLNTQDQQVDYQMQYKSLQNQFSHWQDQLTRNQNLLATKNVESEQQTKPQQKLADQTGLHQQKMEQFQSSMLALQQKLPPQQQKLPPQQQKLPPQQQKLPPQQQKLPPQQQQLPPQQQLQKVPQQNPTKVPSYGREYRKYTELLNKAEEPATAAPESVPIKMTIPSFVPTPSSQPPPPPPTAVQTNKIVKAETTTAKQRPRSKFEPQVDPRDQLMMSIKTFSKEGLKSVQVQKNRQVHSNR